MLDRKTAVMFCRTSAVEYLFGGKCALWFVQPGFDTLSCLSLGDTMSDHEQPATSSPTSITAAKWLSRIFAAISILFLCAMICQVIHSRTIKSGDTSGAMGAGMGMLFILFAWCPIGIFCLISMGVSVLAWRKHSSSVGRTAFWLSLGGLIVGPVMLGLALGLGG